MSFLQTLEASRSAIDFFSDRLNLIGVNIASANTPGYDKQRQLPTDAFYQQLSKAGGVGTAAMSSGVRQNGRETIFTTGDLAQTGQSTDIAINGRGWFPVQDAQSGEFLLSRVGSFDLDADGFLRGPEGNLLMGLQGPPPAFQVSLDAQGKLVYTVDPAIAGAAPGDEGSVLQFDWQGAGWADESLRFAETAPAGGRAFPLLADGSLLTANEVDAALAGLNGGQGLAVGGSYTSFAGLREAVARGGLSTAQADAALAGLNGGAGLNLAGGNATSLAAVQAALDSGAVALAQVDTALAAAAPTGVAPAWSSFSELRAGLGAGLFTEAELDLALAATPLALGGATFDGGAGNGWRDLAATLPLNPRTGEAYSLAEIEEGAPRALGVEVQADGLVEWQFSNGTTGPAAWLRLAEVRDPSALEPVGESLFAPTAAAHLIGDWQSHVPGQDGRGALVGGSLEMSNVDITSEFGDLIASQRSYQASSKMLGVMDELLNAVIQLRR
ncbi:MAG: flagellar hook-basal body complex protein [Opitutales bacterium]